MAIADLSTKKTPQPKLAKSLFWSLVLLCGFSLCASGHELSSADGSPNDQRTVRLQNHTVSLTGATDIGRLPSDTVLSLLVALSLRNQDDLTQAIRNMYDPTSPQYGHYVSTAEFYKRYGPADADAASVIAYFENQGLQASRNIPMLVRVVGRASQVEKALSLQFHQYQLADGRIAFAATDNPSVSVTVASVITSIVGLDNVNIRTHLPIRLTSSDSSIAIGTGVGGSLGPPDIQNAYGFNSNNGNGSGQTLALFEFAGYAPSDVASYAQNFGLSNPPTLVNVLVDGATGVPGGGVDQQEVTIDIELMMAVAPSATQIRVYEGPDSDVAGVDIYAKIADENLASVVSTSWGLPESKLPTSILQAENNAFMQMAAQGQSVFAASGDAGAYDDGKNLSADDPASQPYVTGVGGTTLDFGNGHYVSETAWASGGGGISTFWPIPAWQVGLGTVANLGSQTMRMVPDVSLNSATGYSVYYNGAGGA